MANVTLQVTDVNGKKHSFVLTKDEEKSIIDIAEENGVELPYSCRSGACFSCCAGVNKGYEHLDHEKVGEQLIDTDDTETLTCICGLKKEAFEGEDKEVVMVMMN